MIPIMDIATILDDAEYIHRIYNKQLAVMQEPTGYSIVGIIYASSMLPRGARIIKLFL